MAATSSAGASTTPVSATVMSRSSSAAVTASRSAWLRAFVKIATVPSSSPSSARLRTTEAGKSVSISGVAHGARARSRSAGDCSPPTTAVSWSSSGHMTFSPRKKPVTRNTSSSSVRRVHSASVADGSAGLIGENTSSSARPWMPPPSLMSSAIAWYAASKSPRSSSMPLVRRVSAST